MKAIFPGSDTRPTQVGDMDPWPVTFSNFSYRIGLGQKFHQHHDKINPSEAGSVYTQGEKQAIAASADVIPPTNAIRHLINSHDASNVRQRQIFILL